MRRKSLTAILIAATLAGAAAAQERRLPTQSELRLSYAPVVQHVAPAVVNVYAAKVVQNRNPLLDDPIFRRFFGVPGGGGNQLQRSLGSGVIIDGAGLVVTNNHVIEGADEVKVSLADKREFEATLVLKDPRTDLAVLRIKDGREQFPVLDFADFGRSASWRCGAGHWQSVWCRTDSHTRHRISARAYASGHF